MTAQDVGLVLRANLWKLNVIRILFWMHFFAAVLVPFYYYGAHLTLVQIFFLNSWFVLCMEALSAPLTAMADYFGLKFALVVGCVCGMLGALLYASQLDIFTFLIGTVLFAISYNLQLGSDSRIAEGTLLDLEETGAVGQGRKRLLDCKTAGTAIGALLGGWIAYKFSLIAPMVVYAVPACGAMVLALTIQEPRSLVSGARPKLKSIFTEGLSLLRSNRPLLRMTIEMSLTSALVWSIQWLFQALLMKSGVGIEYFGVVMTLGLVGLTALNFYSEKLIAWAGGSRTLVFLGASFLTGLSFLDLGLVDHGFLIGLGAVVAMAAGQYRIILFQGFLEPHLPKDDRELALATVYALQMLSLIILNPIIGYLADWNLSHVLTIMGVLILAVTVISQVEERYGS